MSGLVSGILDDARNAVGARVDALRGEVDDRVAALGATLTSMMIVMGILIVVAALCGVAIAASLVALGVPLWVALWVVTLLAGVFAVVAFRRARAKTTHPTVAEPIAPPAN